MVRMSPLSLGSNDTANFVRSCESSFLCSSWGLQSLIRRYQERVSEHCSRLVLVKLHNYSYYSRSQGYNRYFYRALQIVEEAVARRG